MRISRNVSLNELFDSAIELFDGAALTWYRSIKNSVYSWPHVVQCLREEFEPIDYDLELRREIQNRTQGDDETVGHYFACMINLFNRLRNVMPEAEKLQILRHNISPYFIQALGLAEARSIPELLNICKRLEYNRSLAEKHQAPRTDSYLNFLEPDLAYHREQTKYERFRVGQQRSRTRDINTAEVKCWNCKEVGHRYTTCTKERLSSFSLLCGNRDHNRRDCPKNAIMAGRRRQQCDGPARK